MQLDFSTSVRSGLCVLTPITPDKVNSLYFFNLHVVHQADIDICTNHLQLTLFPWSLFKIYLARQCPA